MIALRRGEQRKHLRRRQREAWLTFAPQDPSTHLASGFGPLTALEESRWPPQTSHRQPICEEAEIITYVREGTLGYEDSTGHLGLLSTGEFQCMTAGRGIRYGETNTSPTEWARVFQLWLRPSVVGLAPGHEQKHFSIAERRGLLRVVASPDGRNGSLLIHQDALLFSTILDRGQHVVHELSEGRSAWLHVVEGTARCGTVTLGSGDGAGIDAERGVSLTASEETEVLLLDLAKSAFPG